MKVKVINFGATKLPCRMHENDAGADVYSTQDIILYPRETYAMPLGFGLELPDGYMAYIGPRTSVSKKGIVCHECPIDSGYRGVVHAILTNTTSEAIHIGIDERIAQIIVVPIVVVDFIDYNIEERGTGAFGSTGA